MTAPKSRSIRPESGENAATPGLEDDLSAELAALRAELEAAQATVKASAGAGAAAAAEAENVRRRAQEDVAKARKFGIESFAESLVPVKDSLEAARLSPTRRRRPGEGGSHAQAADRRLRAQSAQGNRAGPGRQVRPAPAPGDFLGAGRPAANTVLQLLQKGSSSPTARCVRRWSWSAGQG